MVSALDTAIAAARKAQESGYYGKATVVEYVKVTNKKHLTKNEEKVVLENQPCRLSFESIKQAVQTETVANTPQIVKLFIAPDVIIKAGSKITVTQSGITADYTYSSVPAVYPTHQEIILKLYEERA